MRPGHKGHGELWEPPGGSGKAPLGLCCSFLCNSHRDAFPALLHPKGETPRLSSCKWQQSMLSSDVFSHQKRAPSFSRR